ncbi:hypothetical protein SLEP1_g50422 [Rubroshorea leprosula]|uniref:Uncharacterized protein n=1 Tax=Rubroshorea leprosula TaxID=152421 RepID=A0AAV5LZX9_9ROSI|nr:hypothetical protein SLEP1_g50422 [Rubroshorea leprosula]
MKMKKARQGNRWVLAGAGSKSNPASAGNRTKQVLGSVSNLATVGFLQVLGRWNPAATKFEQPLCPCRCLVPFRT